MIALDSSAIVAIALAEPEGDVFARLIAEQHALVGFPTLVETHLMLSARMERQSAVLFIDGLRALQPVEACTFSYDMYEAAARAFDRYGRGRHRAQLNFGDCMAYAVAKVHGVPLLYKGTDFAATDIRPALP